MMKKLQKMIENKQMFAYSVFGLFLGFGPVQAQTCDDPAIATDPVTVCSGASATLTVTSDGEDVFWYASQSATTSIGEGATFLTPPLTSATSYWAEAVNYGAGGAATTITNGARIAPSGSSGSAVVAATSPWGLVFDAYEDFVLNSVDVFITAPAGGDIVINLLDSNWSVVATTSLVLPAGGSTSAPLQHTITLDFEVPQGNGYRLVAHSGPAMIREFSSEHPGFPYPIGTAGAVTAGSINVTGANPALYYFFYNWTVTVGSIEQCISDRIEVVVTVTSLPDTPEGDTAQFVNEGDLVSDLIVAGDNLVWYSDPGLTQEISESDVLVDGASYYVTQTFGDCQSEALIIMVTFIDPCADVVAPEGEDTQTLAIGSLVSGLDVIGDNLRFYSDAGLTQEVFESDELIDGVTYYVTQTIGDCQSEALGIMVTLFDPCADITEPVGQTSQTLEEGSTLADLIVEGGWGAMFTWYSDVNLMEEIPASTPVEDGMTYYVTQTIGDCQSEALAITVIVTLNTAGFDLYAFKMYPNPVNNILILAANQEISAISLFDILGQKIEVSLNNNQIDMTSLASGNYLLAVTIEDITKIFKVIKQ